MMKNRSLDFTKNAPGKRASVKIALIIAAVIAAAEPDPYGGLDLKPFAGLLTPHEFRALALMAEGYSPGEMASILGIKPRSAIQLRYRITAKLRKYHQPKK